MGLVLGLAWKPYNTIIQKLDSVSAIIRMNGLTGSSDILMPAQTAWQPITNASSDIQLDWWWIAVVAALLWISWESGYRSGLKEIATKVE